MKFKCACCNKYRPPRLLSESSLDESGITDPRKAIPRLRADQLVCRFCDENESNSPTWSLEFRSDYYQYEGIDSKDRAHRDANYLNY